MSLKPPDGRFGPKLIAWATMSGLLYVVICLIWGSTWLAIKIGLEGVPPFLGAGLRFLIATVIFGAVLAIRGRRIRLSRNDKICILSLGLFLFWLDYAGVYWAETRISSGLTAILFSTMPLFTALLARYWTRSEALTGRKLVGIPIGMLGTVLLFWPPGEVGLRQTLGMLAAMGAAICASINLVTLRRYGRDSDSVVLNFMGMGLGAACLLGMSCALESWSNIAWSAANVAAILYLAVFGSAVAFLAYYALIKRISATAVSYSTLMIPIVALALGRLFLDETVTPMAIIGVAIILAGVAVAIVPVWKNRAHSIGAYRSVDES